MKIKNNSIIDTATDYANVKFGMEVKQEDILHNLKMLPHRDTLKLVDAILMKMMKHLVTLLI